MILAKQLSIKVLSILAVALASPLSAYDASTNRRVLKPQESIANAVANAHANGNARPHLTITADIAGASETVSYNVREAESAVTAETTITSSSGDIKHVNPNDIATIMVSDQIEEYMALLAVDTTDDTAHGIVKSMNGKNMKITQNTNEQVWATDSPSFPASNWRCDGSPTPNDTNESIERRELMHQGNNHSHDNIPHDHDDHHDHHSHFHLKDDSLMGEALDEVQRSLRGSSIRLGKRRELQVATGYSYQVDIYIEIDNQLCIDNSEDCQANGLENSPNTVNYVNALFTGANTVFEPEIDTHLAVAHIAYTTLYDAATGSGNALNIMRNNYAQPTWHHPNTDLHFALLSGRGFGGQAYIGEVCSPDYGFGVTGNLNGNYVSMDQRVMWDMMIFMHEVGHSFNSLHTHQVEGGGGAYIGYDPQIDVCGCETSGPANLACSVDGTSEGARKQCPAELPSARSSTLMSYCYLCNGGMDNMAYTFGGTYKGSGDRGVVDNYESSVALFNTEARRVNVKMYTHVSTSSCTSVPTNPPTSVPTQAPTPPPTKSPEVPTPPPTNEPTFNPTSAAPTPNPTPAPTKAPVVCSKAQVDQPCGSGSDCCSGLCSGGKPKNRKCLPNQQTPAPEPTTPNPTSPPVTSNPTLPPVPTTPAPTPGLGGCTDTSNCSPTSCTDRGSCRNAGCNWRSKSKDCTPP